MNIIEAVKLLNSNPLIYVFRLDKDIHGKEFETQLHYTDRLGLFIQIENIAEPYELSIADILADWTEKTFSAEKVLSKTETLATTTNE